MTINEMIELKTLLKKLRHDRIVDNATIYGYEIADLENMDHDTLYDIDDGDNLIQGIDIVLDALE